MEKAKRKYFDGKGPFSHINKLTTQIRMYEAITKYGLGGDSLSEIRQMSLDEFLREESNGQEEKS